MKSIEARLTSGLLAGVALALCLAGVLVFAAARTFLVRDFDASLAAKVGAVAGLTQQEPGGIMMEPAEEFLREYNGANATVFFELWVGQNRVLKKSQGLGAFDLPRPSEPDEHLHFWTLTLPNGSPGRAACRRFVPQIDDDVPVAERPAHPEANHVTVVVAREMRPLERTMGLIGIALCCASTLAFGAVFVAVRHGVRRELQPLARLAEFTAGIDAPSLGAHFPAGDLPTELVPIATRINDLLARLGEAFRRERQFTDDAAHELRTPLTELRTLVEVAMKWPPDAQGAAGAFREIHSVLLRVEALTNSLLVISRCERGGFQVAREPVTAADTLAEAWKAFEPAARERQLSAAFSLGPVRLQTDPVLFNTVLRNLLSNAVAYTPRGGTIDVTARGDENGGELCIANDCEGLEASDTPHLGRRFWRKDTAHSGTEHAGLGLSVVTTVCDVLGLRANFATTSSRFEARLSWDVR